MNKKNNNQSGFILILAILIIGVVVASVAIFSNFIIRGIRQARVINDSIQAYYLAESASERALYQVRRRHAIVDCNDVDLGSGAVCNNNGFCSNDPAVPCVNDDQGGLNINKGWDVAVSNEMKTTFMLPESRSFQIDLFSPIQNSQSNIDLVRVDSPTSPNLKLLAEFTNLTKILGVNQFNCQDQPPVFKDEIVLPANILSLDGQTIVDKCSYSLKLNYPLLAGGGLAIVSVSVFDDNGVQLPIPSRLIIDSKAKFGRSQQELRVHTPMRPPVSELYDFVVFSEAQIQK